MIPEAQAECCNSPKRPVENRYKENRKSQEQELSANDVGRARHGARAHGEGNIEEGRGGENGLKFDLVSVAPLRKAPGQDRELQRVPAKWIRLYRELGSPR